MTRGLVADAAAALLNVFGGLVTALAFWFADWGATPAGSFFAGVYALGVAFDGAVRFVELRKKERAP